MGYLNDPVAPPSGFCGSTDSCAMDGCGSMRYAALYQSTDSACSRGVSCLLMPASGRALVVVITPFANTPKEVVAGAGLERVWREALTTAAKEDQHTLVRGRPTVWPVGVKGLLSWAHRGEGVVNETRALRKVQGRGGSG